MAASLSRTLKVPVDLADVADIRARELGYPSWGAYVKALIRFDSLCGSSHTVTVPWSKLPFNEQDQIDAKLKKRRIEGKGMTSQEAKDLDWKTGL